MATFQQLIWESEFFGFPMLAMTAPELPNQVPDEEALRDTKATLIDCNLPLGATEVARALCEAGFFLCDTAVTFTVALQEDQQHARLATSIPIWAATAEDESAVLRLGMMMDFRSRYCQYPFSPAEGQRFYATWISNAIAGRYDDICLVAGKPDAPAGLLTLQRKADIKARVGLFGVHPQWRRQGVAEALWTSGVAWTVGENRNTIDITTQMNNGPAIRLYRKLGGRATNGALRFYWVGGTAPNDSD